MGRGIDIRECRQQGCCLQASRGEPEPKVQWTFAVRRAPMPWMALAGPSSAAGSAARKGFTASPGKRSDGSLHFGSGSAGLGVCIYRPGVEYRAGIVYTRPHLKICQDISQPIDVAGISSSLPYWTVGHVIGRGFTRMKHGLLLIDGNPCSIRVNPWLIIRVPVFRLSKKPGLF